MKAFLVLGALLLGLVTGGWSSSDDGGDSKGGRALGRIALVENMHGDGPIRVSNRRRVKPLRRVHRGLEHLCPLLWRERRESRRDEHREGNRRES